MHLQRVRVPDFRALKNVDITFEQERIPRIFPLASQNGGGKSTLLQLIFVLLTCCFEKSRRPFLNNILRDFSGSSESELPRILAAIDLIDGSTKISLEFTCVQLNKSINKDQYGTEHEVKCICSYFLEGQVEHVLLCRIIGDIEGTDFLSKVSQNVFFASSGNQVFIMVERNTINSLFLNREGAGKKYEDRIRELQNVLPGFFLYDFSTIKVLVEFFRITTQRDRQKAQDHGQYGDEFVELLSDLTDMFSGKKIEPLADLSGIRVRTADGGELYPEDLSHGELRRLTFYAWLKTKEIQDAIVLVDEIEIGLHPDWQYQIVKDLEDWAPSNQYILATHSYDVCSALTPAHVKEIEPKLSQKSTPAAN